MKINFLSASEGLELHSEQVELYGGSHGIRDLGLLESAVAMPQAGFGGSYLHADLFEMASAYLSGCGKRLFCNSPVIEVR